MTKHFVLILSVALAPLPARAWSVRPAAPEPVSLLSGYALTLSAFGLRRYEEDLQTSVARRRPLGDASKIGDYAGQLVPQAAYLGGQWIAHACGATRAGHRAQLMTVATAEAGLTALVLKHTLREERPNHSSRNSFPSGHSTTVFAFAAIVGAEHGWRYGVPAYALAAFTGFSRINDNMHYLHDVLAGATLGLSVGLGVYLRNNVSSLDQVRLTPMVLSDGGGLIAGLPW